MLLQEAKGAFRPHLLTWTENNPDLVRRRRDWLAADEGQDQVSGGVVGPPPGVVLPPGEGLALLADCHRSVPLCWST